MAQDLQLYELGRDLRLLRESAQDLNTVYTVNHPSGPLQWRVNVDRIAEAVERGVSDQDVSRVLLESIVDSSGQVPKRLEEIVQFNTQQLGVSLTSLALQYQSLEYLGSMDANLSSIDMGVWQVVDQLGDVNVNLENIDYELERVNKNLGKTNKHLKEIKSINLAQYLALEHLGLVTEKGFAQVDRRLQQGFTTLHEDGRKIHLALVNIYLQQQKEARILQEGFGQVNRNLTKIQRNQQNDLQFRANERYTSASKHYNAGYYHKAVMEAQNALKEQSTHLPSLLLLGRIRVHYGLWDNAKDTFFEVTRLATLDKDAKAYRAAVQGLVHTELQVGNWDEAVTFLGDSLKNKLGYTSWNLRKEFFRLQLLDAEKKKRGSVWNDWATEEFETIYSHDMSFWEKNIQDVSLQRVAGVVPVLKYGPFIGLVECIERYNEKDVFKNTDFGKKLGELSISLESLCDPTEGKLYRQNAKLVENFKLLTQILTDFEMIVREYSSRITQTSVLWDTIQEYVPIQAVDYVVQPFRHSSSKTDSNTTRVGSSYSSQPTSSMRSKPMLRRRVRTEEGGNV